jgi:hypothetical protein
MLDGGDEDLVAGATFLPSPRLRDEVDPLGGAAREDDFFLARALMKRLTVVRAAFVRGGGDSLR